MQLGRFRGQVDVEECGFFVRAVDPERGTIALSDATEERLDPATLRSSPCDRDVLLCTVKSALVAEGLPARFTHAAQAELLAAVEVAEDGPVLRLAGTLHPLSDL